MEFMTDYMEFQHQIKDLGESLCTHMVTAFKSVSTCMHTLQLLKRCGHYVVCVLFPISYCVVCHLPRFELLKLKCLSEPISNKYAEILHMFSVEIDKIEKVQYMSAMTSTT